MLIDAEKFTKNESIEADVCIIGAGPAGIVLAMELSRNKRINVLLLEAGDDTYNVKSQELYSPAIAPNILPNPMYSRLRFLGGASNHWANNTSPLDPIDFEKKDWVANSGWPIGYHDIEPFYKAAAIYCGTDDDGYNLDYWLKEIKSEDILSASKILTTGIAKASVPPVRFFLNYGENLKKSSTVRVIKNANLVDLKYDKLKGSVSGVSIKAYNNENLEHYIRAKKYVFSMGGIENARMLLNFNRLNDNKLGNEGGCVGRYFMDHPLPRAAIFYANDFKRFNLYTGKNYSKRRVVAFLKIREDVLFQNRINNIRMPLQASTNYHLSDGISSFHILTKAIDKFELPDYLGDHLYNVIRDIDMVGEAISRKTFNKKIFDHAEEFGGFEIPMMMEQSPDRSNRIYLSSKKDRYGIPKILVNWEIKEDDKNQLWRGLEITARGLGAQALGRLRLLREREDRLWESQLGFGNHHMGTTRMSISQKNGVVDRDLKVFGTNNLYVAGSSVFPTGGHVPPTLTIVALSMRLAQNISDLFK